MPAATVAGPNLLIARSALAVTVVFAVDELLPAAGSLVVVLTDAVFEIDAGVAPVVETTMVTTALAPPASVPRLQVTAVVPEQLPCVGVAETNAVPAGSVSFTVTFCAVLGPLLVAVML